MEMLFLSKCNSLKEFTDPSSYKTYDELKAKLMRVLGEESTMGAYTVKEEVKINEPVTAKEPITAAEVSTDDDDTMSYFAKLAQDD